MRTFEESLALFKRRIYNFNENLDLHIFAEELINKFIEGETISSKTYEDLNQCLDFLKKNGQLFFDLKANAQRENIDIKKEFKKRIQFEKQHLKSTTPKKIVHIIGSPRSGTTFLFNLLAYYGDFAYFSDISHIEWSLYNHINRTRPFLHELEPNILSEDTKKLRIQLDTILPAEVENIMNSYIPVRKLIKSHEYFISKPDKYDLSGLWKSISTHLQYFDCCNFLTKSPFNSFRIPYLSELDVPTYFIHLFKDGYQVTDSIRENKFKYFSYDQSEDSPVAFWDMHLKEVEKYSADKKIIHISYRDIFEDSKNCLTDLLSFIGVNQRKEIDFDLHFINKRDRKHYDFNQTIDSWNQKLSNNKFRVGSYEV